VQLVQTGIYYCPQLDFYAFDIAITTKDKPREYMDFGLALALLKEAKFLHAEPLFTGSFEECISYPIKFQTKLPSKFGLPDLPSQNFAEGVVIKPMKTLYITNTKGKSCN
jgi:hypothetical protein